MVRRAVDVLVIAGGWGLIVYSFAVGVEIVGRRYLGFSLQGVDEIGGYLMAIVVALGFSSALFDAAHIRIDLLLGKLPRVVAMWLNVLALAGMLALACFLVWRSWIVLSESYGMDAVSSTPLLTPMVVPQSLWAGALVLFAIAAGAHLVRAVGCGLRGDAAAVDALAGSSAARAPAPPARPARPR